MVAEAGSFAAAATRLNLSRSAVGKAVARLEERLGAQLCRRTTRVLTLTDDGVAFLERCSRALREIEDAELAIESSRQEPSGLVRVTVPHTFGRYCVEPILSELARTHSKLSIEMSFTDRRVDLIGEGFDLAIRNGPLQDDPGLTTRILARQRLVVCASPGYLSAHGQPRTVNDLKAHEGIVYSNTHLRPPWGFSDENGMVEVIMKSRLRFDDLDAISNAAQAGLGLAFLPFWLVRDHLREGRLVSLLEDAPPVEFNTSALWPSSTYMPSRLRVIIDALAAQLQVLAR